MDSGAIPPHNRFFIEEKPQTTGLAHAMRLRQLTGLNENSTRPQVERAVRDLCTDTFKDPNFYSDRLVDFTIKLLQGKTTQDDLIGNMGYLSRIEAYTPPARLN